MIRNSKENEKPNNYDWCFVSGKVTVLESYMLNYKQFEKLLSADTIDDLLKGITNVKPMYSFLDKGSVAEFEKPMEAYCLGVVDEIRTLSPSKTVCDIFLVRYKLRDIKNSLKKKLYDIPDEQIVSDLFKDSDIEHIWKVEPVSAWSKALLYGMKRLEKALRKKSENIKPENTLRVIDLIMDNAYLTFLKTVSEEILSTHIRRYLEKFIFMEVMGSLLRTLVLGNSLTPLNNHFLKNLSDINNIPDTLNLSINDCEVLLKDELPQETVNTIFSGRDEKSINKPNLINFEKISHDYLLEIARPWKHITFGPERVFGYLCGLFAEAYNLKLVVCGKINRIDDVLLKARLRRCYV